MEEIATQAAPHIWGINPDTVFGVLVMVLIVGTVGMGYFSYRLLIKFSELQRETLTVINNNTQEMRRLIDILEIVNKNK